MGYEFSTFSNNKEIEPGISTIGQIERRDFTYGELIRKKEDLTKFVESPLLSACEILYEKGIRTTGSNACIEHSNQAYIDIDYTTLSGNNKKIVASKGKKLIGNFILDNIENYPDLKDEKTVEIIHALTLSESPDENYWQLLLEVEKILRSKIMNNPIRLQEAIDYYVIVLGYYYDSKKQLFYSHRDLRDENGNIINE